MSSDGRVFAALSSSGVPGTRAPWAHDQRAEYPRFDYHATSGGEFIAGGTVYAALPRYEATLRMTEWDADLIADFSAAVAKVGPYVSEEGYDPDAGEIYVTYTFTGR